MPNTFCRYSAIAAVALISTVGVATSSGTGSPCTLPGVLVISDPSADTVNPYDPVPPPPGYDANNFDIQHVDFAELAQYPDKITYTMKVASLTSIPANASWRIRFVSADGLTYFVSMDTDQNGIISYNYGTFSVTQGQGNYSTSGTADSGSYNADGTITITNSNSKTGSPGPGFTLTAIQAETDLLIGAAGTGFLSTVDDTSNGSPTNASYTLVGNGFCGTPPSTGTRTASYTHGGMTFSINTPLKVAASTQDGEPSSRVDRLATTILCRSAEFRLEWIYSILICGLAAPHSIRICGCLRIGG